MIGGYVGRWLGAFVFRDEATGRQRGFCVAYDDAGTLFRFFFHGFFAVGVFFRRDFVDFDGDFGRFDAPLFDYFGVFH